ncbi:MAG: hypothetical protein ACFFD2_04880 [Promethearchaeota archaeon]
MSKEFLDNWTQAKNLEEEGHRLFQKGEYQKSAELHKKAADLFKKNIEFIDLNNEKIRKRVLGNYSIELANYYYSLATLYTGEKQKALINYQQAIKELKKSLQEYETLKEKKRYHLEINTLKIMLHFFLAHENLCLAQINFLNENYPKAIEFFKTAEIHNNLELEFISEINDFERLKRAKARLYYIKGQIFRSNALLAIQNEHRKEAKENYLNASEFFENASKLYPKWTEYKELAKKTKRMAAAIKD